ncbi:MAG: sigma-70 family RNA polymerase sigma factor [Polyangiaceae bacterium]|nr:sigma-70 family RNA polymerase sigma factor [Polyangiaceae bacterium]
MPRNGKDTDALDSYLDDLSRVSTLSREEELVLALVIENAYEKARASVLTHAPSLRLLAAILERVGTDEVHATEIASDPTAAGLSEEELGGRLRTAGQRLTALLDMPDQCETGGAPGAAVEAYAVAAALPLNRATVRSLFEQARSEPTDATNPKRDTRWVEAARAHREAEIAKRRLAEHNLRLVVTLARRYLGRGLPLDDLIQEGNLGLLRAIDGFDPSRGFRLSTYAVWWIRQAMQHALAEQTRTIRVPRHVGEAASAIGRFTRGFRQEVGRVPTAEEIAGGLGVPVARVHAAAEIGPDVISLATPLGNEESLELGDVIADNEGPSPADVLLVKDFANRTREVLETLSDEERAVIALRFGIDSTGTHSVEEVAAMRRLGTERVRQIEARALRKLRHAKGARHLRKYSQD